MYKNSNLSSTHNTQYTIPFFAPLLYTTTHANNPMQSALPYKLTWQPAATNLRPQPPSAAAAPGSRERVRTAVSENAAIVVAGRGCCMGHVASRLLLSLGVNPALYEVDGEEEERVVNELKVVVGAGGDGGGDGLLQFPAVFIGGRLYGGIDRIMATHITGELTPVLKETGALWL